MNSLGVPYAYQGIEKDAETNLFNFELRQYDARLGRWYNPDPMGQHHSPYLAMGNNPISRIDPNGGWDIFPGFDAIMGFINTWGMGTNLGEVNVYGEDLSGGGPKALQAVCLTCDEKMDDVKLNAVFDNSQNVTTYNQNQSSGSNSSRYEWEKYFDKPGNGSASVDAGIKVGNNSYGLKISTEDGPSVKASWGKYKWTGSPTGASLGYGDAKASFNDNGATVSYGDFKGTASGIEIPFFGVTEKRSSVTETARGNFDVVIKVPTNATLSERMFLNKPAFILKTVATYPIRQTTYTQVLQDVKIGVAGAQRMLIYENGYKIWDTTVSGYNGSIFKMKAGPVNIGGNINTYGK